MFSEATNFQLCVTIFDVCKRWDVYPWEYEDCSDFKGKPKVVIHQSMTWTGKNAEWILVKQSKFKT